MSDAAQQILAAGRAAWPEIPFDLQIIERRLGERTPEEPPKYPADLCLALTCAEGTPQALRVFEAQFLSAVDGFVAKIDSTPDFADEVKQRLRERLLLGPNARILDFSGRGPLGAWLRVASVRLAIDMRRDRREFPDAEVANQVVALSLDPELQLVKAQHREDVQAVLRSALDRLSSKERNVLRMHFANGWTFERIGKCYKVHRATVMRWINAARDKLLDEMAAELGERLGMNISEIRSLTGLLRSQVDASLSGLGKQL